MLLTTRVYPADLAGPPGPTGPMLARVDPLLTTAIVLNPQQFTDLVAFVRDGLLDPRATPERLRPLVPQSLPSGRPPLIFEFR